MTNAADEDLPLVERAKGGDYSALESLVGKYERRLYGLARRIVGQPHDAEEVVQQTFVSVIEHLEDFRSESRFSTWLLRIATNHALALLRRGRVRATVALERDTGDDNYGGLPHPDFIAEWAETPDEIAARRETRAAIDEALAELDEKHRLVFLLRDVEGFSTEETADMLGISVSNTKVRLLRARLMLRERLTRRFGDEAKRLAPHDHD